MPHHYVHAFQSAMQSGFDESLCLTLDGSGDEHCTVLWEHPGTELKPIYEQNIPHSLGWFYAAFTEYLGFRAYNGEYKLMGLAAYGSENAELIEKVGQVIYADPRPSQDDIHRAREMAIAAVNYRYLNVFNGNDRRGIDIGLLSRIGWQHIRSHADKTFADLDVWPEGIGSYREGPPDNPRTVQRSDRIFRRDLVEASFTIEGRRFTLFCCHLKSMTGGRASTRVVRIAEAQAIRAIIEKRFERHRGGPAAANWAIAGDLNDYYEVDGTRDLRDYMTGEDSPTALDAHVRDGFAVNVTERRLPDDRWTTYHPPDDLYTQLDYILVSPRLAEANPDAVPEIIREGQPYRAARHDGPRFPRIGWDRPKSSDHCPVVVELHLP